VRAGQGFAVRNKKLWNGASVLLRGFVFCSTYLRYA
jgi:hypothetical protein